MGALITAALLALLFSSCVARKDNAGVALEPVNLGSAAQASTSATSADQPSLLHSALAKVQDAAQDLTSARPSTGLQSRPLSGEALKEVLPKLGRAEARLIDIYRLISQGEHRQALAQADALVRDHPNFQLAHLVHGDLLSVQVRPVSQIGDVPDTKARAALDQLNVLREESRRRLRALTERPPEGSVPTQFLSLSSQSRHAIAVDASRSRLYLFENQTPAASNGTLAGAPKLRLIGDYYISVGLQGIEKQLEGDKRTPLGVYYITSSLNPESLPDLYGVGALPINYPNPLDVQRGKTGSGIWLHGTPREQFVRAPQASDGCVVLSNPDLEHLLSMVQIRTTPVVIAPELHWVRPEVLDTERQRFEATLQAWRDTKGQGDLQRLKDFYSGRFQNQGRNLAQWWPKVEAEVHNANGQRGLELKDLSLLQWRDNQDTMVVTFGEVAMGQSRGTTKRQYWARENDQWKIFFEGTP
ncbi:L,D-transpeptidase [Hydrogenophaga sp.]|uniref:L,D-transpeptidase family protein n=1 Tax=Hydrogenophaga sp. TaxID=1904254 RepID=UPI00286E04CF|nr:L,D-transpeptidase [Hydrogenophaga sp.]